MAEWTFTSHKSCFTDVLPDGCRDIIVKECDGKAPIVFVSELSQSAYTVPTIRGSHIRGLRLRPGIQIFHDELQFWLQNRNPTEIFESDQFSEFCLESENLTDALQCLASGKRTVPAAAKELGVSLRTLERLVKKGTERSPYFWFSLARARKTARSLYEVDSLSVAALEGGFTDQSHMNREIKKWFRKTPTQILKDKYVRSALQEAGYG